MKLMSKAPFFATLLLSLVFAAGCAENVQEPKEHKVSQQTLDAIAAAQAANKKAASVGYEWRDAGKMIKKAQEAAKKGDEASAMKLAKKAEEQGVMAYAQYETEMKMARTLHQ